MNQTPTCRRHALAAAALIALAPAAQAQVYNWAAGTFVPGTTAPSTLAAGETLNINNGGFKYFDTVSGTFTVLGTVNWNADTLYLQGSGAVLNNGLWDSKVDQSLFYNGGSPSFTNNGEFRKSGGLGATTIGNLSSFVNTGTLNAQSGRLVFAGGSSFNAGSVFTGTGRVEMAGNNSFSGAFNSANLVLDSGTHTGAGATLASGSLRFEGGTLAGSWAVSAGQTLNGEAGAFKYLNGTLTNAGTVAWNTGNLLYMQHGGSVLNQGLWLSQANTSLVNNGGVQPVFDNTGTLRAAAGTTLTVGNMLVNNGGTLDAEAGASLIFNGGAQFNHGSQFVGSGANVASGNNGFAGTLASSNLVLQSGMHTGAAALINGSASLTGGTLSGTWMVGAGHTLAAGTGAFKYLGGAGTLLTNQGTVSWNTTDWLYLQHGAQVSNQGLWQAQADMQLVNNGGVQPVFDNTASGTLRAAAGQTLTVGHVLVNNGGTLDAEAGASIRYTGGSVFNAGSNFSGAGSNVAVGNNSFNGLQQTANLVLQAGVHSANAALIHGALSLTGGTLAGTWTVGAGHSLAGGGGAFKYLDGATTLLTNQGTVGWNTADWLYLQHGAQVSNQGLWLAQADTQLVNNGGIQPVFENTASGTLRAAAGKTLTIGQVLVNNGGALDAQAGASIRYTGGSVFNAGSNFSGAGSNVAAGNNSFNGAYSSTNLVLQSGIHSAAAAVAQGSTLFTGGTLDGTWQVAAGATFAAASGGFKYLSGAGTVFDNQGTVRWQTADAWYLQQAAVLTNAGTLDLQADTQILSNGGAAPSFVNTGLIVKSAGAGTATIGAGLGFSNLGTVSVRSGSLALPDSFSNAGTLTGDGGFSVAGTLTNVGVIDPGDGNPGTLSLAGNYLQAAGGTLAIGLQGLLSHGLFDITGTASLSGTLALSCFAACNLAAGDVLTILDSAGNLSGSFDSVTLSGFGSGAFSVIYDTAADRVQLQVLQNVSAVPEPESWAMMLGGLGALAQLVRRRRPG